MAVESKEVVKNNFQDAIISLFGPFFNLLFAIVFLVVYRSTSIGFFKSITEINAILGLFNLLPIIPFDGSRVINSILNSMHDIFRIIFAICSLVIIMLFVFYFEDFFVLLFIPTVLIQISNGFIYIKLKKKDLFNINKIDNNRISQIHNSIDKKNSLEVINSKLRQMLMYYYLPKMWLNRVVLISFFYVILIISLFITTVFT